MEHYCCYNIEYEPDDILDVRNLPSTEYIALAHFVPISKLYDVLATEIAHRNGCPVSDFQFELVE